jgi:hypothetical protein
MKEFHFHPKLSGYEGVMGMAKPRENIRQEGA